MLAMKKDLVEQYQKPEQFLQQLWREIELFYLILQVQQGNTKPTAIGDEQLTDRRVRDVAILLATSVTSILKNQKSEAI